MVVIYMYNVFSSRPTLNQHLQTLALTIWIIRPFAISGTGTIGILLKKVCMMVKSIRTLNCDPPFLLGAKWGEQTYPRISLQVFIMISCSPFHSSWDSFYSWCTYMYVHKYLSCVFPLSRQLYSTSWRKVAWQLAAMSIIAALSLKPNMLLSLAACTCRTREHVKIAKELSIECSLCIHNRCHKLMLAFVIHRIATSTGSITLQSNLILSS